MLCASGLAAQSPRALGIRFGVLAAGPRNSITDVEGVRVGSVSVIRAPRIRTGVTIVLPHRGNLFLEKVPAGVFVGNGFGKLIGATQIRELGEIESPIALTSTLNAPRVADALLDVMLALPGNEDVRSLNVVVGETNDGRLNDIRARAVTAEHVAAAIRSASVEVEQGAVGAGAGTIAFGFKGGIGTSSRTLPQPLGGWTVGVLVQTNFGGNLTIGGRVVGDALGTAPYRAERAGERGDGSIMIVIATDAPVDARNLERMAARSMMGLARTGASGSNGSGDYAIAFSTHPRLRSRHGETKVIDRPLLANDGMSPLFLAVIEATEEAIINALFAAETVTSNGLTIEKLPVDEVVRRIGDGSSPRETSRP
jgi:D-aminopeptidase